MLNNLNYYIQRTQTTGEIDKLFEDNILFTFRHLMWYIPRPIKLI